MSGRTDWAGIMGPVAEALLGEPNRRASTRTTRRYGAKGSLAVHVAGQRAGTWRDHEAGQGGGVVALVRHIRGGENGDAIAWLQASGIIAGDIEHARPDPEDAKRRREAEARKREAQEREREQLGARAAREAAAMLARAKFGPHPYLGAKGFSPPAESRYGETQRSRGLGMVLDGMLVVPMRDPQTDDLRGLQMIDADGGKKYQPRGVVARGAVHRLGARRPRLIWYVEGFATALSVVEALALIHRTGDQVAVCFSSGNLPVVARPGGIVIADHDWWRCALPECRHRWDFANEVCVRCGGRRITPPAGETAARETGLPWWQPPEPGEDANDYHRRAGIDALARVLARTIAESGVQARGARRGARGPSWPPGAAR